MPENNPIAVYVEEIQNQLIAGQAREHGYRPALERLMRSFEDTLATNDPKRSEHGNPDFIFTKKSNRDIILGYAEAKDITVDLTKIVKTEQLRRYAGYEKLFLTNYLDFRFFRNGEEYESISIGSLANDKIIFHHDAFFRLMHELKAFLELPPEKIRSGKRLAIIMGGKARRIRDNVSIYLNQEDNERNQELEKIFEMMKVLLVHDLTSDKFADMYAQTLVYGLFVARYNDKTPDSFTRNEARDLVPASNPFLREFFDHIVGPRFDSRLRHIVDELCEVFSVSDVSMLIHKHLRLFEVDNEKDPIIHFYEDFLKEYDPMERKKMGAYYTPIPVVRFIIRQVDEILKRDFGLPKGIADTSKIVKELNVGQKVNVRSLKTGRMERTDTIQKEFHRVQVLDPAVGTATFLNEIIKYIYKGFEGQQGRWPAYAEQDLIPRLHGFELMMAPYTIAHLKLGMTLQETGLENFKQRLGVYLTNTLEEGNKRQQDLFSFGLAEAVSHEAAEAAIIKHEKPIMVVVGNPPYSVSSNNKSEYILDLIKDYKKDLNERNIQPLSDDYIKFIRFAEEMISKNGEGIVAMITNNSYVDGLIHRQMRKHLLTTFDKIYVLDLHGNSKKKEIAQDGSTDENVFDIQQGVSILLAIKQRGRKTENNAELHFAELYGKRRAKFNELDKNISFNKVEPIAPGWFFAPTNNKAQNKYNKLISINDLFVTSSSGVQTKRDSLFVDFEKAGLFLKISTLLSDDLNQSFVDKFNIRDSSSYKILSKISKSSYESAFIKTYNYRPFDNRYVYYDRDLIGRSFYPVMKNMLPVENVGLITCRQQSSSDFNHIFITDLITDNNSISLQTKEISYLYPLYRCSDDGTHTPNFNPKVLKELTKNLNKKPIPKDILDYIYAVLHSPKYREQYKEYLRIDFPRVPIPKSDMEFEKLGALGKQLRELHLTTSPILDDLTTTYPVAGTDEVEKIRYEDDKVWINATQYFGNVPEVAWNFYIGGYQPAQKWLKDRKGRKLSNQDIEHYQKIIKILIETDNLMKKVDEAWNP